MAFHCVTRFYFFCMIKQTFSLSIALILHQCDYVRYIATWYLFRNIPTFCRALWYSLIEGFKNAQFFFLFTTNVHFITKTNFLVMICNVKMEVENWYKLFCFYTVGELRSINLIRVRPMPPWFQLFFYYLVITRKEQIIEKFEIGWIFYIRF